MVDLMSIKLFLAIMIIEMAALDRVGCWDKVTSHSKVDASLNSLRMKSSASLCSHFSTANCWLTYRDSATVLDSSTWRNTSK